MNCYDHHEIMINSGIMMFMKQPPFPGMYRTRRSVDLRLLIAQYKDMIGNDVISIGGFIKYLQYIAKEKTGKDSESLAKEKTGKDSESEDKADDLSLESESHYYSLSDLLDLNRRGSLISLSTNRSVDGAISQNGKLVTNSRGAILLPTQAFLRCLKNISKRKAEHSQGDNRNQEEVVNLWNGQFDCWQSRCQPHTVPHHSWLSEIRWPTDSRLGPFVEKNRVIGYEEFGYDFTLKECNVHIQPNTHTRYTQLLSCTQLLAFQTDNHFFMYCSPMTLDPEAAM